MVERHSTNFWDQAACAVLTGKERFAEDAGEVWHRDGSRSFGIELIEPLPVGARVLEVGCGQGLALREISIRRPDAHITGVDFSMQQLALAKTAIPSGTVELFCLDLNFALPTWLGHFDLVLSIYGALDFVHVPQRGLENCLERLTAEGRLLLLTNRMQSIRMAVSQISNTKINKEILASSVGVLELGQL